MSQLQVVYVGGVATFSKRDDMIYRGAKWVGVFQTEVHRLATDPAHRLRCVYSLPVLLKLTAVPAYLS